MRHRSNTLPPPPHHHADPFYAPTNLATRLRANPQPSAPLAPAAAGSLDPDAHHSEPAAVPEACQTHAPHSPGDSVGVILLGVVLVLLVLLRSASSSAAARAAENARLVEERGQFVVGLLDWGQRLLEADTPWLPSANATCVWSYGYTSLEPLARPPLAPLAVQVHEAAFSAETPLIFPPTNVEKLSPRVVGLEVSLAIDTEQAEVPRYGWWRSTELAAIGGERVVLQAIPPPVIEVEYFARVFYFVPV